MSGLGALQQQGLQHGGRHAARQHAGELDRVPPDIVLQPTDTSGGPHLRCNGVWNPLFDVLAVCARHARRMFAPCSGRARGMLAMCEQRAQNWHPFAPSWVSIG
ncbi:MAG: hypothetical protein ACRYHQ_23625 [Janthinobacterium lividum]